MSDNLLTWSVKNWITVFLMFLLGWAVVAFIGRLIIGRKSSPSAAPDDSAAGAYATTAGG